VRLVVRKLTEAEKAEIAELWAQKLPVRVIARADDGAAEQGERP
jgi:hypothetical protein